MFIFNRFEALRKARGITKKFITDSINRSQTACQDWKAGKSEPNDEQLAIIAEILQTTPEYLRGETDNEKPPQLALNTPTVAGKYVTFPILGEIAAGYEHIAYESWDNGNIDIPESWLKGKPKEAYFVVKVVGDSMHPDYQDGDLILALKQDDVDYSGQVAIALYDDECATLKRVIFSPDKTWYRFQPINPQYGSVLKRGEELSHCKILGIPKKLIRNIEE